MQADLRVRFHAPHPPSDLCLHLVIEMVFPFEQKGLLMSSSPFMQLLLDIRQIALARSLSPVEQQQAIALCAILLDTIAHEAARPLPVLDFQQIRGHAHVKRALEVAAAGGHALLLIGAPHRGKAMLARTLSTLLPDPVPLRAPTPQQDLRALVGSLEPLVLGELTLAHEGILFVEDLARCERAHLDALVSAMQEHVVRPHGDAAVFFPARFQLVATLSPCPCGNYADPIRECVCTAQDLTDYHAHCQDVVASCFEIRVDVEAVSERDCTTARPGEYSGQVRQRVEAARASQQRRFLGTRYHVNADLDTLDAVERFCAFEPPAHTLLTTARRQRHLSMQTDITVQRVARSIADLAQHEMIHLGDCAEALTYARASLWG